ncbi:hypothetical protein AB6A23_23085 [Paenibacillus tarimensis]
MDWIAVQPYYKVLREVNGIEDTTVVEHRQIYLYVDKIVTKHREFLISEVFDMSYRQMGNDEGLLYLHTKRGVYSYPVKENPESFIEAFKVLD